VAMPEVSAAIMDARLDRLEESGADVLAGGDVSCLMHLEGGLRRRGSAIEVRHIAELLTPDEDGAPTRIMRQFLGISVHRRIPVELHELGPLLLVSMPCEELPDPDDQFFECSRAVRDGAFDGRGYLTRTWWELRSGWRTATDLIFAAFGVDGVRSAVANDEKLGEVRLYRDAPNLALAVTDRLTVVFVIKPAGLDRVDVLAAVYGRPADADEVSAALIDVENRIAALPRVDRPSPISDWAARILRADG